MSKEKELLKECRLMLDNPINGTAGRNLQIRITELLAQPEQGKKASQREPLSDQEIYALDDEVNGYVGKNTVRAVMRWIRKVEKAHGIGGGE